MSGAILASSAASSRVAKAAAWLSMRPEPHVTVVGATLDAAAEVARRALLMRPNKDGPRASFGWKRSTLGTLAVQLAAEPLARLGLVPAFGLTIEAVCAHVIHGQHQGGVESTLGRFKAIGDLPGLPRALARTVTELRLAGTEGLERLADPDLARLLHAFETELETAGLADHARTLSLASAAAASLDPAHLGAVLFVDVSLHTRAERDFVAAIARRSPASLAVVPAGDDRSIAFFERALETPAVTMPSADASREQSALSRLHDGLFGHANTPGKAMAKNGTVEILSAPGESRECVEIARMILAEAAQGTKLDRIAVLLRTPAYAAHLEEALRRAKVPAHFARGTRKPDTAGRAMLALLACAAEGLSARRFAEYLSLGEVPDEAADGSPKTARPPGDRVAPPDDEVLLALLGHVEGATDQDQDDASENSKPLVAEEDRAAPFGTLRAPRHWEKLLVEAAVIGGRERWERRIRGLEEKLAADLEAYESKAEDALADLTRRDLSGLVALRTFALPIIDELAGLPLHRANASWGDWLDALAKLATRAIRHPERVLAILGELRPMAQVGPVAITEVRLVLERRLAQLVTRAPGRRYGKVYIGAIDEARGLDFEVVFVPGLAEKIFPQKVVEDPLLLDDARRVLGADLKTHDDRAAEERLALRLAVGNASRRVVFSYPRVDVEQARPRTPSFYGLEVLRVAEGELRDFHYLAESAASTVDARIGWPAPKERESAIDEAEYDLALLESVLEKKEEECVGEAHYLLSSNPHLARALRFRGRRWLKTWKAADGLVDPPEEALVAIREHAIDKRSFSPTALQNFAACPYRFFLSAVHRIARREEPAAIEDLDPLTRGSLVHEVQFALLTRLRAANLLPVTKARLEPAREMLDAVLLEVAQEEHDRLHPAIERVWKDSIESIAADLREWLRRMPEEPDWTPAHFELSFGLKDRRAQDALSKDEPVELEAGIKLRGSIDLVEKDDSGRLRATDHKTGKVRAQRGDIIKKGEVLQPVLYALTLEKLFPASEVKEGRLYYCTTAGDFTKVDIPLTDEARSAGALVAKTIGEALSSGFLPAAPAKDACRYCDFRSICGPYEEIRTRRKSGDRLKGLNSLRRAK